MDVATRTEVGRVAIKREVWGWPTSVHASLTMVAGSAVAHRSYFGADALDLLMAPDADHLAWAEEQFQHGLDAVRRAQGIWTVPGDVGAAVLAALGGSNG